MIAIKPRIEAFHQRKGFANTLLTPLSHLFRFLSTLRRRYYQNLAPTPFESPVLVVGNISVGGNGKTPILIALGKALMGKGLTVGVVSRGYGGAKTKEPLPVETSTPANECGDEPLMIKQSLHCPVVVCQSRVKAVDYLLTHQAVDVVLSDDGLQHYALYRDIELAVVTREGLGNGLCLPAGPLREPRGRLEQVDFILAPAGVVEKPATSPKLVVKGIYQAVSHKPVSLDEIKQKPIVALCGIAHPSRFFNTLNDLGLTYSRRIYADHYPFRRNDFSKDRDKFVLMTEKDAVKCQRLALDNLHYLKVEVVLDERFVDLVVNKIKQARTV